MFRHFLGIVSLVLSEIWHVARNLYEVVRDRDRFFENFFFSNIGKKGPKWAKTSYFFQFLGKFGH